jgi:hypothetical protein
MEKRTDLAYYAFKGCKVSGMYHGIPFSGIVTQTRWNTVRANTRLVWIDLDTPIDTRSQSGVKGICLEYTDTDWVADTNYIDYIDPTTYPNKG